jgi:DNA-binding Lrp family transcriptional regulator
MDHETPSSPREEALRHLLLYQLRRGTAGRRALAERTGLSEMRVRQALEAMHADGLIQTTRAGVRLRIAARAMQLPLSPILCVDGLRLPMAGTARHAQAALLTPAAWSPAWVLRDLAVAQGASMLLAFRRIDGRWAFSHNAEPVAERNTIDSRCLAAAFPESADGDAVIWVGGNDRSAVFFGLWKAILACSYPVPVDTKPSTQ